MQCTTSFALLAVSTFVYFSCTFTTVYGGKCSGRWAIHACYGGNGKRSGRAQQDTDNRPNDRQYILRQLLLSDRVPSVSEDMAQSDSPVIDDVDSIYPELEELQKQIELKKIRNVLTELLLERRFRDTETNELDYQR